MMIRVDDVNVWGFNHAMRGMRNPMNSWDRADTIFDLEGGVFRMGDADQQLMHRLFRAGTEHRKYMRQIFVSMDITAPLYWWKEFDTYKVGTTANSCSTMHKIAAKEFTDNDFSLEHLEGDANFCAGVVIETLNDYRKKYLNTKDKRYWWCLIQLLPSSYNQKRTVTMDYENAASMIRQRTGHKLDEWNDFVKVLSDLPYMDDIMNGDGGDKDV
jgi:hypothetical protein